MLNSLIATLSEATVRLIEGVPVSDHVDTREWIYYTFFNVYRDTRNFKVIMSSTTGDADMVFVILMSFVLLFSFTNSFLHSM